MASPLTIRIVAKADTAALDGVNQKLKAIGQQTGQTTKETRGFEASIDSLVKKLQEYAKESAAKKQGGGMFGDASKELSGMMSIFKTFRRFAGIVGLITGPILLAQKNLISLDTALKPLNASLSQIGKTSQVESARLLGFINTLTSGTSTSILDGVAALTVFVDKTKSTVDIEKTLSAAHVLATARGIKFAEATAMITDALDGEASALARTTLKSKQQINELVKSGQLTKVIEEDFKGASDAAQSGAFEFWKKVGSEFNKGFTKNSSFVPILMLSRAALQSQQQLTQTIQSVASFKQSIQDLATSKISFTTLDDFKVSIAKIEGALNQAKTVISTGLGTPAQIGAASKVIPILEQQLKIVQDQKKLSIELALPERNRLRTEAMVVGLQADLYTEQNRSLSTLDESNKSLETQKQIRGEILKAQQAQIHAEMILGARQQAAAQGRALTPEQRLSWATKEIQKRNEVSESAYKTEASKNLKILDSDTKLQRARLELQKFYLQNRLKQYSGQYSYEQIARIENQFVEKEVQFAIEAAKREGLQLLAEGRLTATEKERIEKDLQLKLTQIRQEAENTRSQETKTRLGALSEIEQARVIELVKKRAKGPMLWTEEKELEGYKKVYDEKLKIAKETDDALNEYFGENVRIKAEKTTIPGDFTGQLQDMVKKARVEAASSKDLEKLSNEFKNAFTPDEQEAINKIKTLRDKAQELVGGTPVKIPVAFETVGSMNTVVQSIILEIQRQLINGRVPATIGQGPEQGGSES